MPRIDCHKRRACRQRPQIQLTTVHGEGSRRSQSVGDCQSHRAISALDHRTAREHRIHHTRFKTEPSGARERSVAHRSATQRHKTRSLIHGSQIKHSAIKRQPARCRQYVRPRQRQRPIVDRRPTRVSCRSRDRHSASSRLDERRRTRKVCGDHTRLQQERPGRVQGAVRNKTSRQSQRGDTCRARAQVQGAAAHKCVRGRLQEVVSIQNQFAFLHVGAARVIVRAAQRHHPGPCLCQCARATQHRVDRARLHTKGRAIQSPAAHQTAGQANHSHRLCRRAQGKFAAGHVQCAAIPKRIVHRK